MQIALCCYFCRSLSKYLWFHLNLITMKLSTRKLTEIIELLPDFETHEGEYFDFQVHKKEHIIFTLPDNPIGVPVYNIRFKKNHRLDDWEMIL